eukprot:scaffold8.g1461.t1
MADAEVSFYGVKVPPGKAVNVVADFDDDVFETIHLTQVALGEGAQAGPHTVFIQTEGEERFAIGTLDRERCAQFSVDVTLATNAVAVSHTGKTDVYLTGYRTVTPLATTEDEDDYYRHLAAGSDEGECLFHRDTCLPAVCERAGTRKISEGEEESEDEEAPQGVPLGGKARGRAWVIDDEAEEGSESEDEETEQEDEEEEEEESEEEEELALELQQQQQKGKKQAAPVFNGLQDSSEGEEESEDEEEEEESEEEEPAPKPAPKAAAKPAPKPAKAGDKRPPAALPAKTPQPAKKARGEDGQQKAPATAPAKVGAAGAAPANQGEYVAALKRFLKDNGPQKLASLGSKVKRPDSLGKSFKLKQLLLGNASVFKYDATADTVSLA